jgi:hypothetical protein
MGRLSDTVMNAVLDELFGGANYTPPATVYIGLSTTAPGNDGATATEPVGNGYARVATVNDLTNWPAATGRAKSNAAAITFPTASGAWGTVTDFVVYDAASGGTFYAWGALVTPQVISAATTPSFAPGSFIVTGPGA